MDSRNILSLLGLALRGGNLAVGEEPVEAVARARDARLLLLASDAADNTRRRTVHFSEAGQCLWLQIPCTKAELGRAVGRTSVALVAVTDIGLANAVARRLAALDQAKYGEAAQRLELKAKRAAERQAEMKAHEKNVRTGKYKAKPKPAPAPAPAETPRPPRAEQKSPPQRRTRSRSGPHPEGGPKQAPNPYAHSRPVKKGKGSFRKKEG